MNRHPLPAAASVGADLLAWRQARLREGGRAADLDWLLDLGAGVSWQQLQALRLHPERSLPISTSLARLEALWNAHLSGQVPVQYLVGRCPWRDLELQVSAAVLIPRPETEGLVELALGEPPPPPGQAWADLGTGSGCLALALALAWPETEGLAVDLSDQALAVAAANLAAAPGSARVTLRQGSWWDPLRPWWGRLAVVVANPPYIPTEVWRQLDPGVRCHEPALALDGGDDGLASIRRIVARASEALAPGGLLLLEHHHDQSPAVIDLLRRAGLGQVRRHRDLEGTWRFASARNRAPACAEADG